MSLFTTTLKDVQLSAKFKFKIGLFIFPDDVIFVLWQPRNYFLSDYYCAEDDTSTWYAHCLHFNFLNFLKKCPYREKWLDDKNIPFDGKECKCQKDIFLSSTEEVIKFVQTNDLNNGYELLNLFDLTKKEKAIIYTKINSKRKLSKD